MSCRRIAVRGRTAGCAVRQAVFHVKHLGVGDRSVPVERALERFVRRGAQRVRRGDHRSTGSLRWGCGRAALFHVKHRRWQPRTGRARSFGNRCVGPCTCGPGGDSNTPSAIVVSHPTTAPAPRTSAEDAAASAQRDGLQAACSARSVSRSRPLIASEPTMRKAIAPLFMMMKRNPPRRPRSSPNACSAKARSRVFHVKQSAVRAGGADVRRDYGAPHESGALARPRPGPPSYALSAVIVSGHR